MKPFLVSRGNSVIVNVSTEMEGYPGTRQPRNHIVLRGEGIPVEGHRDMKAQEPHSSEGGQCPRERVCCDTGPQERHGSEKTPPQQKRCSSQGRVPAAKLRSLRAQPGS